MTQPRFKVVFNGELMPDVELETAKDSLALLFKSDRARINTLFSGSPIAIKRDLQENEADHYLAALQRAGVVARKEPDLAASMSLVDIAETPVPVSSEPMTCPKCGHQQTKSSACVACGVIIEKFLARQAQLASSAPEKAVDSPVADNTPAVTATSPYATPQANVAETLPAFGELKVFSISGRIGRLRYLAWFMANLLVFIGLMGLTGIIAGISPEIGGGLTVILSLAVIVVSVLIVIHRLHDIGWTGWLWPLILIPLVQLVFSILLMVIPGTKGANRYGPPPPANGVGVYILSGLFLLFVVIGIVSLFLGGFALLMVMLSGLDLSTLDASGG
ncbi:MAG: DUF805 domain-containing protein [Pseudomonas sp.]|uniref:DUF805 domain-containing protein n=1 Tax=Pseudomonas sp. TaxID=306 RepID=UPI003D0EA9A0